LLLACSFSLNDAEALNGRLDKYDSSAKRAYESGDFKKAQTQWEKLRAEISKNADQLSEQDKIEMQAIEEKTLRQIGECALQLKSFALAADLFNQARVLAPCGDAELEKDYSLLSSNYRLIEPNSLGSDVAKAFKAVGAEKISICKTETGHHIEIMLADKVVKPITQKGVSEIGFDKTITFELSEPNEGEVRIDRITGLKVHVQFWVNVIASRLHKNDEQQTIAEVTGEKMGISQSISTKLPEQICEPVMALIGKVKNVFNSDAVNLDIATKGNNPEQTGGLSGASGKGNSVFSNAINGGALAPGELVPTTDMGENGGKIAPLVNDQPANDAK